MITIKCIAPIYWDVDDTLVKWGFPISDGDIPVTCPAHQYMYNGIMHNAPEWMEVLRPHKKHIAELKKLKAKGHTIVVWSAGGWAWADAVVKALKLEEFVDLVIEKPTHCYDDLGINGIVSGGVKFLEDDDEHQD